MHRHTVSRGGQAWSGRLGQQERYHTGIEAGNAAEEIGRESRGCGRDEKRVEVGYGVSNKQVALFGIFLVV